MTTVQPCPVCRYTAWTVSAETGAVLYCAVCNARDSARDCAFERDRAETENKRLRAALLGVAQMSTATGLCWCCDIDNPDDADDHFEVCLAARAALKEGEQP